MYHTRSDDGRSAVSPAPVSGVPVVSASTLGIENIDWNPHVQSIANDFNEIKAHIIENAPSRHRMDEFMSEYVMFMRRIEPKLSVWRGVLFLVLMGVQRRTAPVPGPPSPADTLLVVLGRHWPFKWRFSLCTQFEDHLRERFFDVWMRPPAAPG